MVVTNDLTELPRSIERVEEFCRSRNIPRRTAYRFALALDEALTNIISYAFTDARRHEIEVQIEHRGGALAATVSDDGMPFDPLSRPPPDVRAPAEDRKVGGLGIHLVRALMDSVEYRRTGDRNRLTFRTQAGASGPRG
jgi:anti-sigma regulatory factor (Ser/Thr protein kinase)